MKNRSLLLISGILLAVYSFAQAQDTGKVVDVNQVQMMIKQSKKNWVAKESWVSQLSRAEAKRMLGLKNGPTGTLDYESTSSAATSIDWRNNKGVNWLGPVMNQGNCGSCVAFATVATLEAQTSIASGMPWLHPTFSPQEIFACGGGGCDSGWEPASAAHYLKTTGIPDEACMPYTSGSTGNDVSCSDKCQNASARSMKISGFKTPSGILSGKSVDSVKAALLKGPLVTTLNVYADFMTYSSGVYQHVGNDILGGHAISIVGYDDTKRAWLIRNSWGEEWGEKGFAWVSWDDTSGVGSETWSFDVASTKFDVSIESPMDRAYVSGNTTLSANVAGTGDASVEFVITDDQGNNTSADCQASAAGKCDLAFDTTKLKEGHYQIAATSKSSKTTSQVREFFILNSVPKMSLSFVAKAGTDLGTVLNGRPEFIVTASMNPVPIQHVEFRAIDSTGKIASIKANDYVLGTMDMGWRTLTVPSGKYKILFHGETTYLGKVYSVDSNSFNVSVETK